MAYVFGKYEVREDDPRGPVVAIGYAHGPTEEPHVGDVLDPRQLHGRRVRVVSIDRESTPPLLVVTPERT